MYVQDSVLIEPDRNLYAILILLSLTRTAASLSRYIDTNLIAQLQSYTLQNSAERITEEKSLETDTQHYRSLSSCAFLVTRTAEQCAAAGL